MRLPGPLHNLPLPIIQAPMAGVQDLRLARAVADAGGVGSVPCAMLDAAQLDAVLAQLSTPRGVFNLNFFCHAPAEADADAEQRWRQALAPYYREYGLPAPPVTQAGLRRPIDAAVVDQLAHHRPALLSFHFGLPPAPLLRRIKAWGATVLATATTLEEGQWLQAHGADAVIAQGWEAGGHRGHFLGTETRPGLSTRALVQALAMVLDVPVVAAGGVAGAEDAAALRDAGAALVQAGTAFLLCPEATTSAVHRAALESPTSETAMTNLFSGRPARGITNRLMRELGPMSALPPAFPWASQALAPLRAAAEAAGHGDFSPLWSGTGTCRWRDLPAAEVARALAGQA